MPAQSSARTVTRRNLVLVAALVIGIEAVLWWLMPGPTSTVVDVEIPELSPVAQAGREAFGAYCAQCHGEDAGGHETVGAVVLQLRAPAEAREGM